MVYYDMESSVVRDKGVWSPVAKLLLMVFTFFATTVHADSEESFLYAINSGLAAEAVSALLGNPSAMGNPSIMGSSAAMGNPAALMGGSSSMGNPAAMMGSSSSMGSSGSNCDKMVMPGFPEFYLETFGNWDMKQCMDGMQYVQLFCGCIPALQEEIIIHRNSPAYPNAAPKDLVLVEKADILLSLIKSTPSPTKALAAPSTPPPLKFKRSTRPPPAAPLKPTATEEQPPSNPKPPAKTPPVQPPAQPPVKTQQPPRSPQPVAKSHIPRYDFRPAIILARFSTRPPAKPTVAVWTTTTTRRPAITTTTTVRPTTTSTTRLPPTVKQTPPPTPNTTPRPTTTTTTRATTTTTRKPTTTTLKPTTTTIYIPTTTIPFAEKICAGCEFERGIGYIDDANDCNKYITCYSTGIKDDVRAEVRSCGVGKYWDQTLLTCRPSQDVPCRADKCKGRPTYHTYSYAGNCRAYWECIRGVSVGHCCPRGEAYMEGIGCRWSHRCNASCWDNEIIEVCDKQPVPGNPLMFRQRLEGHGFVDMRCADGTVFNKTTCNCQFDALRRQLIPACRKEVEIDFTTKGIRDISGNAIHLESENVTLLANMACFHGDGAILIPRFSNAYIGDALEIKLKFRLDSLKTNSGFQSLLYNGDCNMDPSVVVSANRHKIVFTLRNTDNVTKSIATPYSGKKDNWVDATLTLVNNIMSISLFDNMAITKKFYGSIARSRCGLKIGWGENYESFHGCIDKVSIAFCSGAAR